MAGFLRSNSLISSAIFRVSARSHAPAARPSAVFTRFFATAHEHDDAGRSTNNFHSPSFPHRGFSKFCSFKNASLLFFLLRWWSVDVGKWGNNGFFVMRGAAAEEMQKWRNISIAAIIACTALAIYNFSGEQHHEASEHPIVLLQHSYNLDFWKFS